MLLARCGVCEGWTVLLRNMITCILPPTATALEPETVGQAAPFEPYLMRTLLSFCNIFRSLNPFVWPPPLIKGIFVPPTSVEGVFFFSHSRNNRFLQRSCHDHSPIYECGVFCLTHLCARVCGCVLQVLVEIGWRTFKTRRFEWLVRKPGRMGHCPKWRQQLEQPSILNGLVLFVAGGDHALIFCYQIWTFQSSSTAGCWLRPRAQNETGGCVCKAQGT